MLTGPRLFADALHLHINLMSHCVVFNVIWISLLSGPLHGNFNPSKCCVLHITNKRAVSTIHQDYFLFVLFGTRLKVHDQSVSRCAALQRRQMEPSLVRPTLSYAFSVYDLYTQKPSISSCHVTVTALIKELGWSELSSARKRNHLCM